MTRFWAWDASSQSLGDKRHMSEDIQCLGQWQIGPLLQAFRKIFLLKIWDDLKLFLLCEVLLLTLAQILFKLVILNQINI